MLHKKCLISLFIPLNFLSYVLVSALPAKANSDEEQLGIVRSVSRSVAEGRGRKQVPYTIYLSPGLGVNLSFIPVQKTVRKAWLDNPAIATDEVNNSLNKLPIYLWNLGDRFSIIKSSASNH